MNQALRVMSIMAHQDDFEFNAGGTFALLRQHYGDQLTVKVVATTRGAFGHHEMSPEDTFFRRAKETRASSALIEAEYECLRCLDGNHLPGQVFIDRNLLGGLWNTIRDFKPDLIFCPPVIEDPLAGVHIDHVNTAHAVRLVAYQLICPHAYPTINGPVGKDRINPVIINVDDVYACGGGCDFYCDVSPVYDLKTRMGLCHESQIYEWLPWTSGADEKVTSEAWKETFKKRHELVNRRYGKSEDVPREYFKITAWGRSTTPDEMSQWLPMAVFPN